MAQAKITRRNALRAGAAAAVGATVVGTGASEAGAGHDSSTAHLDALMRIRPEVAPTVGTSWPALAAGEQVTMYLGLELTAVNGPLLVAGAPYWGGYATASLGAAFSPPIGSLLTGVDMCVFGQPIKGTLTVTRYVPDGVGYDGLFLNYPFDSTISGQQVISASLGDFGNGTRMYDAVYIGGGAGSVIRGIRFRYIPTARDFQAVAPLRVYDSRLPMTPDTNGKLASGANRTVSVANGRDLTTGATTIVPFVPTNASAIAYTLTAVDTTAQGFLSVNPGGNTVVASSTINWSAPGEVLANTSIVSLGPNRTVTVIAGGGGSANFAIDVVGWYL